MPHRRTTPAAIKAGLLALVLTATVVALYIAHADNTVNSYPSGGRGWDISFPQCNQGLPGEYRDFTVVGVNRGRPFTHNQCLLTEHSWALGAPMAPSLYINTSAPIGEFANRGEHGPAGDCATGDLSCISYNFGFNAAADAYAHASSLGITAQYWWLDVETANSWSTNTEHNARSLEGAANALSLAGRTVGVYSTSYQWSIIAGSYRPGLPVWYATGAGYAGAPAYCDEAYDFAGGGVWLVQYYGVFDENYSCEHGPKPTPSPTVTSVPPTVSPTLTTAGTPTVTASFTPAASSTPTPVPSVVATATPSLHGDVNCDRVVNAVDATLVLQHDAGLQVTLSCLLSGDANRDGRLNALDATLILQFAAGVIDEL